VTVAQENCPDCVGNNPKCPTCLGTGMVPPIPQIEGANLPDALLMWMGAIQQRVEQIDAHSRVSAAPLLLGILIGIAIGHWLL
jgi:hypothetical protein